MYFRLVLLCLLLLAGCTNQPSEPVAKHDTPIEDSAQERLKAIQLAEKFNANLTELNALALKKETNFEFMAAATIWSQIRQLVTENLGENSWQAFNANLAYERALVRSNLKAPQLDLLRRSNQLIKTIEEAIQAGESATVLKDVNKVVAISSELFGSGSIEVARALVQQATLENSVDEFDSAIKHFHQAIQIFRNHEFGSHPELENAYTELANAYFRLNKLTPAVANQKEAARLAGQIWGRDSLDFAKQANELGVIFHKAGNLDVAFEILDRSRAIREEKLGDDHVAFAHSCMNLGILMMDLKRTDNAEEYLQKALAIFERDFGTEQNLTNRVKSNLGTIYMLRKQPQLAERILSDVVESLEPGSDEWIKHQFRLSVAYAKQGKYNLAKPLMESVIQWQKERYGNSDGRTVQTLNTYAMVLEKTNQPDAAKTVRRHIDRMASQVNTNDFKSRY